MKRQTSIFVHGLEGETSEMYVTEEVNESAADLREVSIDRLINGEEIEEGEVLYGRDEKSRSMLPYKPVKEPLHETGFHIFSWRGWMNQNNYYSTRVY